MNLKENENIKNWLIGLKESMLDFISHGNEYYSEEDVDKCVDILTVYLEEIQRTTSKEQGMEVIKKTIFKLNDLNEKCEHVLIETGQREQIADIIIKAGELMDYTTMDDDITEEWREW